MTVYLEGLPAKLPTTENIRTAAANISTAGKDAVTYAEDGAASWAGLSAVYTSPDDELVSTAPQIVKTYAEEAETCSTSIKDALDAFAETIDGLKAEYDAVKAEAATHNAVDTSVEDFDWDAHGRERSALQGRIDAVATTYDEASKTCADAISAANTGKLFEIGDGGLPVGLASFVTTKALEGYSTKGNATYFTYEFANPRIVRPSVLDRLPIPPGLVNRLDEWVESGNRWIDEKHRRLLPDVTKNRFVTETAGFDPFANPRFTALMASPTFRKLLGARGANSNASFRRLLERHHISVKDGTITVGYAATLGDRKGKPKVPGWAKNTLRGINVGGHALGFASATSEQYEELRTKYPDWSEEQLMAEAVADGATTQFATALGEEVGSKVGTAIGRAGGAALGQALIPIPGVGAAVGGVVGGFVGNFVGGAVGGWVGGKVGGWIADNTNFTEAAKDIGGAVSGAASKAKDFIGGLFG
ncbi:MULTISPECIES: hypothetical protein [Micrococcus]|uniref:Uncharacterized protein n=1 Tax=Micrococcus terreus TaxID=574650 RepID=A0A1I7MS57_9MICC|nr:hypothetical protein [Micrococcus terreus]SFV24762.1 hypothetical protein SAMN04487966_11331 [Micrococcus terreus]